MMRNLFDPEPPGDRTDSPRLRGVRAPVPTRRILAVLVPAMALFCILAGIAMAREPEILVEVDRTRLALGESLRMEVKIVGAGEGVDVSGISDFKVISRGRTTNVQIVNGAMKRSDIHAFVLVPEREGRLTIPSLTVRAGGREHASRPVSVEVAPRPVPDGNTVHDVFVRAEIRPETLYEGQSAIYTFRFFQAVQVANARYREPQFAGFAAEELEKRNTYRTPIEGREFHVTEIRYVLIPVGPGDKRIEPATLECDVLRSDRRRDPFFLFEGSERRILKTESVSATVRPLPPYDGVLPFSGLVGAFDLSVAVDENTVRVGDSITHSTILKGTGNIIDATPPDPTVPESFKVYADSPQSEIAAGEAGYEGTRIFRNALVPTEAGEFVLSPMSLVYFDAEAGEYRTRTAEAIPLTVRPGEGIETAAAPPPSPGAVLRRQVEFTGRDILPIRESPEALDGGGRPFSPGGFLAGMGAPALLSLTLGLGLRIRRRKADPKRIMNERSRKALKSARKATADSERLAELHRALVSGILGRAGRIGVSATAPEARVLLREAGVSEKAVAEISDLLDRIDAARFGGPALSDADREALPERTADILRRLGR